MPQTQKICVAAGKGGVGKSTLSVLLAASLHARGRRVLLVDCDIGLPGLDLLTGAAERLVFNWADAALHRCTPGQALVQLKFADLLCAPATLSAMPDTKALAKLLQTADRYDYILLDAPAGLGSGFEIACAAADRALLVTTPDAVSVRAVCAAGAALRRMGILEMRLVMNRFDGKLATHNHILRIDDCIDQTQTRLIGILPFDSRLLRSWSSAEILQKSPLTAAAARIAARLENENVPLQVPKAS